MILPYITLQQRGEVFFLCKLNADTLVKHLNFHFREPYSELKTSKEIEDHEKYIQKLQKAGIELSSTEEGIQRRVQIDRIKNIKDFIESNETNFLPSNVLLSADVSELQDFENNYLSYEDKQTGAFKFPDNFYFSIIDGQHRLAGLALVESSIRKEMEIPIVLFLNVSRPVASKLFADINGKQKSVSKSLIYDLSATDENNTLIKRFQRICSSFYQDREGPLYRQIKMLGIGHGSISQAFFIDYTMEAIDRTSLKKAEPQEIYNQLFKYFRAFQETFPDDWPVPRDLKSHKELEEHEEMVLKYRKSQLLKTNGFGAILKLFPDVYHQTKGNSDKFKLLISRLHEYDWTLPQATGTGKGIQGKIKDELKTLLEGYS